MAQPAPSKAMQPKAAEDVSPLTLALQQKIPTMAHLLPEDITTDQFRAATWLVLSNGPDLHDCDPKSVVDCVIKAATFGMLPGRDCHFLPFRDKRHGGKRQATFVPNYFGILRELDRTGKVAKAFAHAVYSKDVFMVDYLADVFTHQPALGHRGQLKCFYGCVAMKDGTRHVEVLSLEDVDRIQRRAPSHDEGPWVTDYEMMARKTALKRVCKYVRLTPRMQQLLEGDEERETQDFNPKRGEQAVEELWDQRPVSVQKKNPEPEPEEEVDPVTGEVLERGPDWDAAESARLDREEAEKQGQGERLL